MIPGVDLVDLVHEFSTEVFSVNLMYVVSVVAVLVASCEKRVYVCV